MVLSLFPRLLDWQFYGPLFLRLALGIIFLIHGYNKLSKNKTGFAGYLESLHFKPGKLWAWAVALTEFFGGILLIIGLWAQIAAMVLAIQFLIIFFWVKRGQKFVDGREFDFLILFALLALIVLDAGAWAIDLPL